MKKLSVILLVVMLLAACVGVAESNLFTPGTYEGSAPGFHGPVNVTVEVSENAVTRVTVGENSETWHIGDLAFPVLEESIVENQSLADVVSGATFTSRAINSAVAKALESAGASAETIDAMKAAPVACVNPGDTETDVVVIGAGVAGMVAAAQAKEAGADVILLEKSSMAGGSARYSAGAVLFVGIPEMEEFGFDAEDVHRWINIASGPILNDDNFYKLVNGTKETYDFVHKNGYEIGFIGMNQPKLAPIFRLSFTKNFGTGVADQTLNGVLKNDIDLRYNTKAASLIQAADGTIEGVVAENAAGTYEIHAKKVILATGGFSYNKEMLEKYAPDWTTNTFTLSFPGTVGDGHEMGVAAGGTLVGDGVLQIYTAGYDPRLFGNMPGNVALFVDSKGHQFCAMDEYYGTISPKIIELEDKIAWGIFSSDAVYVEIDRETSNFAVSDMEAYVAAGKAVKADTIEELAEKIKVDPQELVRSVEEHNWYCDLGINDRWGTAAEALQPIHTAPYYAMRETASVMGTITGLKVDTDMRVLNANDEPIPNLYAVGELIFGNYFNGYYPMSGTAIGTAMTSGRFAGQHAAESIR